jgi:uncharacterized protein DUF1761
LVPLLRVRDQAARLQALHELRLQCDESHRHVIALATRFVGIKGRPEVRGGLGRCDPLQVGGTRNQEGEPVMMGIGSLNYLPILAAAVASFVFGGIWYSALSRPWMEAVGMSPERMQKDRGSLGLYVLAFVAQLVMAVMLAGILVHLALGGFATTLRTGLISAGFLWLGFVIPTMLVNYAFHGAKQMLTLIDGGHWLAVLLIQGGIMGWWGVR